MCRRSNCLLGSWRRLQGDGTWDQNKFDPISCNNRRYCNSDWICTQLLALRRTSGISECRCCGSGQVSRSGGYSNKIDIATGIHVARCYGVIVGGHGTARKCAGWRDCWICRVLKAENESLLLICCESCVHELIN